MRNGQTPAPADDLGDLGDGGVDFSQFFTVLREHLWLIVLFTIVGGLAGLGYVARMPRTYLAQLFAPLWWDRLQARVASGAIERTDGL